VITILVSIPAVVFLFTALLNVDHGARSIRRLRSGSKWIGLAWVLMLCGPALWSSHERAVVGVGSLDRAAVIQILSVSISGVIALSVLGSRQTYGSSIPLAVGYMLLYVFAAIASSAYSMLPMLCIYKALILFVDALLVLAAIRTVRDSEKARLLVDVGYFILAAFVGGAAIGALADPASAFKSIGGIFGVILQGTMPYMNANELGFISAVTFCVGIRRTFEKSSVRLRLLWASMAVMALIVLVLSQSRTAVIGVSVALSVLGSGDRRFRPMLVMPVLGVAILISHEFIAGHSFRLEDTFLEYMKRGQSDESFETMSGRTTSWRRGWDMFLDSPLVGHGYEVGVRYVGAAFGIGTGSHMHNAHMQVLVNTGILGYLAWAGMVLAVVWPLQRANRIKVPGSRAESRRFNLELVAVATLLLVKTMASSTLVFHSNSLVILMGMMVYNGVSRLRRSAIAKERTENGIAGSDELRILRPKERFLQ
jgi:O-antigen ligase